MVTVGKKLIVCLFLTLLIVSMESFGLSQAALVEVKVKTDKTSYSLRELVSISGNVTYSGQLVDSGLVGIRIKDPLEARMAIRTIPTGTAIQENWGIEIVSVEVCDSEGAPKDHIERRKFSYFKVTVKNNWLFDRVVMMTISVYDSACIPLGTGTAQTTIAGGHTASYTHMIWIERWASVGNGMVYSSVFDESGYPYSPEKAINVTIIESEYEEPPQNPPPEQPVYNGSYEMKFRLPPEPQPGIYYVSAHAWYYGMKSSAITTFSVEDIVAPPRASFTV